MLPDYVKITQGATNIFTHLQIMQINLLNFLFGNEMNFVCQ